MLEAYSQGNVNDLITKVEEAAEKKVGAGEIPDIFAAYADTAYKVDKLGLVASIDKYMSEAELASYRDEYVSEGQIGEDGSLKIFPIAKSTELMMLNKTDWDRFAEASGATLDDLKTIEGRDEGGPRLLRMDRWSDAAAQRRQGVLRPGCAGELYDHRQPAAGQRDLRGNGK